MKKTRELIASNLKLVDAVVEVCDARIPISGRNPVIDELIGGKTRVLVLNKRDLADDRATDAWLDRYRRDAGLRAALALNGLNERSARSLLKRLDAIAASAGRGRPLRIMVVGVPNSGKSSLINRLVGRKSAATGDRPGVTRGKQWLTLANGMQLLDTPGILWPKFEDPEVGLHLAFCGAVRDEIMDIAELGLELIRLLLSEYPDMLAARFRLDLHAVRAAHALCGADGSGTDAHGIAEDAAFALKVMERIAAVRGLVLSKGRFDPERTAGVVLDEFRSGKIGRITLEHADRDAAPRGGDRRRAGR
jgi:ribosome biogenesis GTPase A